MSNTATGAVYVISCAIARTVKIGYTAGAAAERLAQLDTTGTPGELDLVLELPGTLQDERALHAKFADSRVRPNREWFYLDEPVREFIAVRQAERATPPAELELLAKYADRLGYNLGARIEQQRCLDDVWRVADPVGRVLFTAWLDARSLAVDVYKRGWDAGHSAAVDTPQPEAVAA